ncbi:MAG TPA: SAM-dependent methyltransferase [Novosphingobium sp.]|nr:SAM-dependent methyltransferase [Novosphingobium sp.]
MSPTPLGQSFARLIAATGPISVARFMADSNARYYATRDPLGSAGDFVTAPEVSQMFGELIGVCLADAWRRAGSPSGVRYVELGPGRGTLARDACRAMRRFGLDPSVHFVEASAPLRDVQRELHPGASWHDGLETVPGDAPIMLVANEFVDALPVRQLVRTGEGWRERMVALEADRFVFVAGAPPMDAAVPEEWVGASEGAILETCPAAAAIVGDLADRLARRGGAALIVDYGHVAPRLGSTLQAVRAHRKLDPFAAPGEADLTAHVDFAALAAVAEARGARWLGTVEQGRFLAMLGIEARAAALAAVAPGEAEAVREGLTRLTANAGMGALFKVMGLAAPGWPDLAGF